MNKTRHNLLLADDDTDDRTFFKEALEDLPLTATLTTVNDGVELMKFLSTNVQNLPDVLFLDLNMPLKNGFECLSEIKLIDQLKHLIVIIFSTSLDMDVVDLLYDNGAHLYIRKPDEYSKLKEVIFKALALTSQNKPAQPARDQFILQP